MAIVDCQTYVLIQLVYLLPEHIIKISPLAHSVEMTSENLQCFFIIVSREQYCNLSLLLFHILLEC